MTVKFGLIALSIGSLSACTSFMDYYVIDQPVGRTVYQLGEDSDIAILLKAQPEYGWTYEVLEPSESPSNKLYQLINNAIQDTEDKNLHPVEALNNSSLGVSCLKTLCQYQGKIINRLDNLNNGNNNKERYSRIIENTFTISFNPYDLDNSYQFLVDKVTDEVPFEKKLFN